VLLALVACNGDGDSSDTPTPTPAEALPTPALEPIPLPPQVTAATASVDWGGFLSGEIEFAFDNPDATAFALDCSPGSVRPSVGQVTVGADGAGALAYERDYLGELAERPDEFVEVLTCTPDNGSEAVVVRLRVDVPEGLLEQLDLQRPAGDNEMAFIAVHKLEDGGRPVLEVRLREADAPGTLDCSSTPAGSPTTYLSGDVREFTAEDAVVQFPLPDVEATLERIAPEAKLSFLCNLLRPGDTITRENRTLELTVPLD
jgi:hypothetical protein